MVVIAITIGAGGTTPDTTVPAEPASSAAPGDTAGAAAPSGETVRIGLVLPDLTNQTINDLYKGAQAWADELGNIELSEGGTSDTPTWLDAGNALRRRRGRRADVRLARR